MPCRIDNTSLLPTYRPDEEVTLIPSSADGLLRSPDWTDELVLVEVHPETATREGTLESLLPVLDHLAALGVNGVWLTPIYEKGPGGNGYGQSGAAYSRTRRHRLYRCDQRMAARPHVRGRSTPPEHPRLPRPHHLGNDEKLCPLP